MSNEEQHQEDEFDKAFSEAAEGKDEAAAEGDGDAGAEPETDTSTDEGEAGETGGDEGEEDWRARAEAERQAREEAEQRMRSWDGRLRKSNEELSRERKAREKLEQRLTALEQQGQEGDRKKLQEWLEDYGDDEEFEHIASVVRDQLKAAEAQADTEEETSAGEQEERTQEVDEETKAHLAAIEAKHSDWQERVSDLDAWIETLPGKQALEYTRVKQQGTAQEVIAMLDALKEAKLGNDKGNDEADDADAMAAVRHRSGGKRPKGRAGKDDFDGAWAEAVSQD